MGSQVDTALQNSMRTYFQSFFSALETGSFSINSFLTTLSSIHKTIQTHRSALQKETLLAVHDFSSVINVVSSDLVQVHKSVGILDQKLASDLSNTLNHKMANLTICEKRDSLVSPAPISLPAYIKPSYDWLLRNLHNPYPPKDVKQGISLETKCSMKDIDAWFIDTRKRIGWNTLRKTKFSNKQEMIITAATRIFKQKSSFFADDLNTSLISEMDPNDVYRSDFLTIQRRAQLLYANKFPEPTASLDYSIQPLLEAQSMKYSTKEVFQSEDWRPSSFDSAALDYPTPQSSPPSSVADESPASAPLSVSNSPSRKRRQSSEPCNSTEQRASSRPSKRHRSDATSSSSSPLSKSDELSNARSEITSCTEPSADEVPRRDAPLLKRKRRLSDGQGQSPPKRPHNALCLPRLHTVSDPLPIAKHSKHSVPETTPITEGELSDAIPSPANLTDPESGCTESPIDFHQYDCSPYNPEIYLSELFANTDVPHGAPEFCNSTPLESVLFTDSFYDNTLHIIDPSNLSFEIVDIPFGVPHEFPIFANPELLSLASRHASNYSLSIGHPTLDDSNSMPSTTQTKNPAVGDFNILRDIPCLEVHEAKRARARILRQELALYEAEGL